jgi:hypothetical protein
VLRRVLVERWVRAFTTEAQHDIVVEAAQAAERIALEDRDEHAQ